MLPARTMINQFSSWKQRYAPERPTMLDLSRSNGKDGCWPKADKRHAVLLLREEEWGERSDREIGRRCCVSATLVKTMRRSLDAAPSEARTYVTKHGTTATMNTENIGRGLYGLRD